MKPNDWRPISPEQIKFFGSNAYELLFGGAAGPGKTDCLLMESLRQIGNKDYNAVIFRRSYARLEGADGMIARSLKWFPAYDATYNISKHYWTFPSGARIYFAHCQNEKDVHIYQGWQIQYLAFDELTEFTEYQYLYLLSRNRASIDSNLRCYVRSATNPGGTGHAWVKKRFVNSGVTNQIGHFTREKDIDTVADKGNPLAKSRTYIPAYFESNPKLPPSYIANLKQLDPVTYAQLAQGDWNAENLEGRIYPNWKAESTNVSIDAEYDPDYPVYWSCDDGFINPRSIHLYQERPFQGQADHICCFAEYYRTKQLAEQSIREILSWDYPPPEFAYYDPAAPEFAAVCESLGIPTWGGYNNIAEGVKVVRRFIQNAQGIRRFHAHPRCEHLIIDIPNYQEDKKKTIEKGGDPIPLKDGNEHTLDDLRYFLATRYLYD